MIRTLALAAAFAAAAVSAPLSAQAQTVGLDTTKGGATAQISTALAAVITKGSDLMVRPQEMANTSQYLPLVDSGRLDFGIANYPQTAFAITGTGMSEGQPNPNIVMVATLVPFNAGLLVPSSLGITDIAGLKGKRVPRFPAGSLGDTVISAVLSTAGLTYDDVVSVPTANFPAMFQGVKDGVTDVTIAAIGSKPTFDIEAALGGVTFLNLKEGDGKVLDAAMPGTRLRYWKGRPAAPGANDDTVVFYYAYTLFANKDVSDEVVTKVVTALWEGEEGLKANGPLWAEYDPAKLAQVGALPYHPAAEAFYKEKGVWASE
ncbi:MAG: TAXI family TRAP transporter solute-binding subunit [Pseudomonadota bacterium]|nr:TAXI family TRAP transporter solute-binding subunit [Pseudomonadota bacterium]